jgi:hypothetical protein
VLFGEDGADETDQGGVVGEDTDDVAAAAGLTPDSPARWLSDGVP